MNLTALLSGALNMAATLHPAVGIAAQLVNTFLPANEQLNEYATGQQVLQAYDGLNADNKARVDQQAAIELANIQASTDKLAAMVSAETATGNTRPFIAQLMAWAVFIAVMLMMLMWGRAVWVKDADSLKQLADSWPLMLAILATPTALLRAYFGLRTEEKKARYAAATGQPIANAVGGLMKLFNKK